MTKPRQEVRMEAPKDRPLDQRTLDLLARAIADLLAISAAKEERAGSASNVVPFRRGARR